MHSLNGTKYTYEYSNIEHTHASIYYMQKVCTLVWFSCGLLNIFSDSLKEEMQTHVNVTKSDSCADVLIVTIHSSLTFISIDEEVILTVTRIAELCIRMLKISNYFLTTLLTTYILCFQLL